MVPNPPINHHQSPPITNHHASPGDTVRFKVKIPVRNVKEFTSPSTPCLSASRSSSSGLNGKEDTSHSWLSFTLFPPFFHIFPLWIPNMRFEKCSSKSLINSGSFKVQPSHVVLRSPTAQSVAAPQDSVFVKNSIRVRFACLRGM